MRKLLFLAALGTMGCGVQPTESTADQASTDVCAGLADDAPQSCFDVCYDPDAILATMRPGTCLDLVCPEQDGTLVGLGICRPAEPPPPWTWTRS